jgi:hypothetical protein
MKRDDRLDRGKGSPRSDAGGDQDELREEFASNTTTMRTSDVKRWRSAEDDMPPDDEADVSTEDPMTLP